MKIYINYDRIIVQKIYLQSRIIIKILKKYILYIYHMHYAYYFRKESDDADFNTLLNNILY